MSAPAKMDENTVPETSGTYPISKFAESGLSGRESPKGFTHPAYYHPGPIKIEKNMKLLSLEELKQLETQAKTPTSPLTARPYDDDVFWPPELLGKQYSPASETNHHGLCHKSETLTDPSISTSQEPVQMVVGNAAGDAAKPPEEQPLKRQRSKRMWNFRNIDETEKRSLVPDRILYNREIELWRSDVIRNGASMVGIQDGITIFCRKMGEQKPNATVLNVFGAFIDKSIAQMVEVKEYYEEHYHHLLERENALLHGQLTSYKKIIDMRDDRIRELEKQLGGNPDVEEAD